MSKQDEVLESIETAAGVVVSRIESAIVCTGPDGFSMAQEDLIRAALCDFAAAILLAARSPGGVISASHAE
jgi:hypothetical protein